LGRSLLRRCSKCGRYTFQVNCSICGSETINPHPARFSPDDKYAKYRARSHHADRETALDHSGDGGDRKEEVIQAE